MLKEYRRGLQGRLSGSCPSTHMKSFAIRIRFSDEDIKSVLLLFQVGCLHPDGHPLLLQFTSQQLLFTFWSSSEISSIVFCFIALTSNSLKPFIHFLFVTLIYLEQHNCTCGSQTTACRNWFSPPTRWVPGIELRPCGLAESTLLAIVRLPCHCPSL